MWITGQVVDDRGQALRDVTIEASGPNTAGGAPMAAAAVGCLGRRAGVTNARGEYVLQDLRPGAYTITFARSGFSTVERKTDALTTYVATINARLYQADL
jgi:protocatechuate 3,4-dioxygenase beta subunit